MPGSSAVSRPNRWHHRRGCLVLLALALGLDLGLDPPAATTAEHPAQHATDGCRASVDSVAVPATAALGEPVSVRTRVRFHCPERRRPVHVVVVVDQTAVAEGAPGAWSPAALAALVERFSLATNTGARVGVIVFDDGARTLCMPTNRADLVARCIERLALPAGAAGGQGGLKDALALGIRELVLARALGEPQTHEDPVREELLVLAAAEAAPDPGAPACVDAVAAGDVARHKGIAVGAVCLAGNCDDSCLPRIASVGQHYGHEEWDTVADRQVARAWSTQTRVRHVTLRDLIAPEVVVDPDSPDPDGAAYDPVERSLRWDVDLAGRDEARFAHVVRPTVAGGVPVRTSGQLFFEDTLGSGEILKLPLPRILVSDGRSARIFAPFAVRLPGRSPQTFGPPAREASPWPGQPSD